MRKPPTVRLHLGDVPILGLGQENEADDEAHRCATLLAMKTSRSTTAAMSNYGAFRPAPALRRGLLGAGAASLGHALMQPGADVVGCVRIALTLVARDQHSARNHAGDTGQPNPLP